VPALDAEVPAIVAAGVPALPPPGRALPAPAEAPPVELGAPAEVAGRTGPSSLHPATMSHIAVAANPKRLMTIM
jgi:hypothetical protein